VPLCLHQRTHPSTHPPTHRNKRKNGMKRCLPLPPFPYTHTPAPLHPHPNTLPFKPGTLNPSPPYSYLALAPLHPHPMVWEPILLSPTTVSYSYNWILCTHTGHSFILPPPAGFIVCPLICMTFHLSFSMSCVASFPFWGQLFF
jgi:hypothetical protein